ncbi:MAG: hypothetical protein LWY06_04990 [Firmicutes bacterium]|nr:hypothetical protein [Bacillota bacterium]
MGYIDWSNVLGEIDLDFLNPLLNEVSNVYDQQWKDTKEDLITSDPYGSSVRENALVDAAAKYGGEAAGEKADILTNFYQAMLNNKFKNEAEEQKNNYDELKDEYENYQDEHKNSVSSSGIGTNLTRSEMRRLWLTNPEQHPYWSLYHKPATTSSQSTSASNSNHTSSAQSSEPSGFTILNPSFLNSGIFGGITGLSGDSYGYSSGSGSGTTGGSAGYTGFTAFDTSTGSGGGTGGWMNIGAVPDGIGVGMDFAMDSRSRSKPSGSTGRNFSTGASSGVKSRRVF